MEPFACMNGCIYMVPSNSCLLCKYCTKILYDLKVGPYMWMCQYETNNLETCWRFEKR